MTSDRSRGHRQSVRLPGYDCIQPGAYFATICTHRGECLTLRRACPGMHCPYRWYPARHPGLSADQAYVRACCLMVRSYPEAIRGLSDARRLRYDRRKSSVHVEFARQPQCKEGGSYG